MKEVTHVDQTIYTILLWLLPLMLSVLAFIGALGVRALIQMSKDLSDIKTNLNVAAAKHEALEERVDRLEERRK